MWSVGTILAALVRCRCCCYAAALSLLFFTRLFPLTASAARQIFRREHFFRGRDNEDQLLKIVKVLGTDDFERYLNTYRLFLQTYNDDLLQRYACMHSAFICLCREAPVADG